jgi:hypothetical protein
MALNEEIFQAAATLGEALIHKRHELFQTDLKAAVAVSKEIVGEKMTNILITQAQKPEPEVNPLLVQVVLQIFMVEFCVSKLRSWYPGNSEIEEFLSVLYSEIRSTGEVSHCFKTKFCLTYNISRGPSCCWSMACSYSFSYKTQRRNMEKGAIQKTSVNFGGSILDSPFFRK